MRDPIARDLSVARTRRLIDFNAYNPGLPPMNYETLLSRLLMKGQPGFLIHGGPGFGKSQLLRALAHDLKSSSKILVVGPLKMGIYRGQTHASEISRDILGEMLDAGWRCQIKGLPGRRRFTRDLFSRGAHAVLGEIFPLFINGGVERIVILLDDFDDMHPAAAVGVANELSWIYNLEVGACCVVLTTETDLNQLYREHTFSPLKGVTDPYLLTGFNRHETLRYINTWLEDHPEQAAQLIPAECENIYRLTDGYPVLIESLLILLHQGRKDDPAYSLDQAVTQICTDYYNHEPLRSLLREIEDIGPAIEESSLVHILNELAVYKRAPDLNEKGTYMLLAMGIFFWKGRGSISWANPIIAQFWESTGRTLLATWYHQPVSLKEDTLSAQGTLRVTLLMDLGWFLRDNFEFETRRGSLEWVEELRKLAGALPEGSFKPWQDQEKYSSLGHDLNLFRLQITQNSFPPIYSVNANDLSLNFGERLAPADQSGQDDQSLEIEAALHKEWIRWDNIYLQLTRSGAARITLVRIIPHARPVMTILDDLLQLEQEFSQGEDHLELSLQWELAIGILGAFLEQSKAKLPEYLSSWRVPGLPLKAHTEKPGENSLYPSHDRFVVYQFRKLCNCRPGKLIPVQNRQIVTIDDFQILLNKKSPAKPTRAWQKATSYGQELATLLEGVMVEKVDQNTGSDHFPPIKLVEITRVLEHDCSSWRNELFNISLDNALIIYNSSEFLDGNQPRQEEDILCHACGRYTREHFRSLRFSQRAIPYEDYWQCVILGLEYLVELRWAAQWVASQAVKRLVKVASYMNLEMKERDKDELDHLLRDIAMETRMVSHLREATIPMSIASADYAVQKYETFIEASHLRQVIQNSEKDLDAINNFLLRDQDQREQAHSERTNLLFTVAALLFACLTMLAALPSFWADFKNTADWAIGTDSNVTLLLTRVFSMLEVFILAAGGVSLVIVLWRALPKKR